MKSAGVVLDFYDDVRGAGLKKVFPTADSLPEQIKTAHILNPEERAVLRDEAYAVVMQDGGKVMRKFACVDPGNTLISMIYFAQNYELMPQEAVKVAAANLAAAGERFGIEVPVFIKLAAKTGMARKRDPMKTPVTTDENDWAGRTNLISIQGGADTGRVSSTLSQTKTAEAHGGGERLTNDKRDVPTSAKMPALQKKNPMPAAKKNVSNYAGADGNSDGAIPENPATPKGPQPTNMPADRNRYVNITGKSPQLKVKRAHATRFAMGDKYPIDSYQDVQRAVDYWSQHWTAMSPENRREYAVKTAARAAELNIEMTPELERYGSTEYSTDLDAHISSRKASLPRETADVYNELQTKIASMEPEEFASLLGEMDKVAGLTQYYGGPIKDHFYSTFGPATKIKQANWYWESTVGDYLSADDLNWLSRNGRGVLKKHFSSDIVDALQKDPFQVFDSLPDDSKRIIAHMANDRRDGVKAN